LSTGTIAKELDCCERKRAREKTIQRDSNTFDHILQVEKEKLIISEFLIDAQKRSEKPNA